ncbi:MAG: tetraacyldisaccharide 4'-kinase [Phycisphaeraceae bacterium]
MRRADAVIVTRSDQINAAQRAELDARIQHLTGQAPLAHTCAVWRTLRSDTDELSIERLRQRRVAGACGIGNAQAFERQLRDAAGEVVHLTARGDHHAWQADELQTLLQDAAAAGAEVVVTTEKDWVKWQPLLEKADQAPAIPIWRPTLTVRFLDGEAPFVKLLQERVGAPPRAQPPSLEGGAGGG